MIDKIQPSSIFPMKRLPKWIQREKNIYQANRKMIQLKKIVSMKVVCYIKYGLDQTNKVYQEMIHIYQGF